MFGFDSRLNLYLKNILGLFVCISEVHLLETEAS